MRVYVKYKIVNVLSLNPHDWTLRDDLQLVLW